MMSEFLFTIMITLSGPLIVIFITRFFYMRDERRENRKPHPSLSAIRTVDSYLKEHPPSPRNQRKAEQILFDDWERRARIAGIPGMEVHKPTTTLASSMHPIYESMYGGIDHRPNAYNMFPPRYQDDDLDLINIDERLLTPLQRIKLKYARIYYNEWKNSPIGDQSSWKGLYQEARENFINSIST